MDPIVIDPSTALGSIAGIVTLTIAIVHLIKRQAGDTPFLRGIPAWLYAVAVSALLTVIAHAVLHSIEGELPVLLVQGVLSAVLASGTIEIVRNWNKPIAETSVAIRARETKEQP